MPLSRSSSSSNGRAVIYGIRPEHLEIANDGPEATVVVVEPTGSETQVVATLNGHDIVAVFRERHNLQPGQKVRLRPRPDMAHLFAKETGGRL